MLSLSDWLLLAAVCAAGAITPGISLAVITRHAVRGGHAAGIAAALAHAVAVGLWALATVAGLALLFRLNPVLETGFRLAGALFLLCLAWSSWQASRQPSPASEPPQQVLQGALRDGFMIAFLNPKVALFFVALFSQFLHAQLGNAARAQMVFTAAIIDGGWYALVALLIGRTRLQPWLLTHHRRIEQLTALLMVLVAGGVLAETLA